jgi:hypothetical protein
MEFWLLIHRAAHMADACVKEMFASIFVSLQLRPLDSSVRYRIFDLIDGVLVREKSEMGFGAP